MLKKSGTLYQQLQIDVTGKKKQKSPKRLTFAARLKLDQANLSSPDQRVVTSKKEVGEFLAGLLVHLLERFPLSFIIVRTAVSIQFKWQFRAKGMHASRIFNHIAKIS